MSPGWLWLPLLLLVSLCGCATAHPAIGTPARRFDFQRDTFAYTNEVYWAYQREANGKCTKVQRQPPPTYASHCYIFSRSARQFFANARFDAHQPVVSETAYRRLIHQVVTSSSRRPVAESQKIVIPGYADLRAFSQAQEKLLKEECGGLWQSYFQRGNWRMVPPFSRPGQHHMAEQLLAHLKRGYPVIVHLVRFPHITINHAVLLFDAKETDTEIQFRTYDPNQPAAPTTVTYNRARRTFLFPASFYFRGGRVNVYEMYWKWNY